MKEHHKTILGLAGTVGSVAVSFSALEIWLRLASLGVGIVVGVLSAISIALTVRRKWKHRNDPFK